LQQTSFFRKFEEQLHHRHPLYNFSQSDRLEKIENAFEKHYSKTRGIPAKPIQMMMDLLLLKHVLSLSSVMEQWAENAYYQYFFGETYFTSAAPCVQTELVRFRKRIREASGISRATLACP